MTSVRTDDRVVFLPEAAQRTEDQEWTIRMQALAELRALNEDPPEHANLPDRQ
jgi:hypothetical protein